MACPADNEHCAIHLGYVVADIFFLAFGLTVQSYIVASNLMERLNGNLMTPTDQIITSLGISRFVFHFVCLCIVFQTFVLKAASVALSSTLTFVGWLSTSSSVWLSVLLSVFLCLKISNIHNVYFLRVRAIVSKKVVHLIVLSLLWSGGLTSLCFIISYTGIPENSTDVRFVNHGLRTWEVNILLLFLLNIICFLMYFFSAVPIIMSLCLHMNRMKSAEIGKMATFTGALKFTIVSFLTCVAFSIVNQFGNDITARFGILEFYIIWNIFPLLHSLYLISATAKLRNRLLGILRQPNQIPVG